MEKLFYLPGQYMPSADTLAHKLLAVLADGQEYTKQELMEVLGDDPRSPLQALRGPSHGFWLMHNLGSQKGIYQLDGCHLSGNRELDLKARSQAELNYLECSRQQAERETQRLPRAIEAESLAKASMQESFDFSKRKLAEV